MAETETPTESEYWCYNCDKRVVVETLPHLICFDCKNGFVESISTLHPPSPPSNPPQPSDLFDDPNLSNQFYHVLRLLAQAAREDHSPPSHLPSSDPDEDYLRIELDTFNNNDDDEEEEDYDDDDHSVVVQGVGDTRISEVDNDNDEEDEEEILRRRRREIITSRLRDFDSRAANNNNNNNNNTRRNRILGWAEILMGLEDHSIELRLELPDDDDNVDAASYYIGNPGDYVDAAGYEALLENLADAASDSRRGAPPASKAAVEALESVVIENEEDVVVCAVCKDMVCVGEVSKNLPCGHGYHGDCIVPWLGFRNTCPVCRFELVTDDLEYEEERNKKRAVVAAGVGDSLKAAASSSSTSGSGGGGGERDDGSVLE